MPITMDCLSGDRYQLYSTCTVSIARSASRRNVQAGGEEVRNSSKNRHGRNDQVDNSTR